MKSFQQASIAFSDSLSGAVLIVGVSHHQLSTQAPEGVQKAFENLRSVSQFEGTKGQRLVLGPVGSWSQVVAFSTQGVDLSQPRSLLALGRDLLNVVESLKLKADLSHVMVALDLEPEALATIAEGFLLSSWQFTYRTAAAYPSSHALFQGTALFYTPEVSRAQTLFEARKPLVEAIGWGRSLVAQPANYLNPETFAQEVMQTNIPGLSVKIIEAPELKAMGAHALLGVSQGSPFPGRLALLEWMGGPQGQAPVALVGKGVTFDTGGISIKPSGNMDEMKADMTGAAVVATVLRQVALAKLPISVVGLLALVENMPSGTAQRPGDVVTSLSGQTIEILNTDAEGRLILADALTYAEQTYQPEYMVDLATLTGAMGVALGDRFAGLFSPADDLANALLKAGQETGESLWRMPMDEVYDRQIDSKIADMKNIANPGYGAGSATAAHFLKRFVTKTPWAHLDIANVANVTRRDLPGRPAAQVFGARLLFHWLTSRCSA